jgi:hypothetical protein
MISTLTSRTATRVSEPCLAGALAMERQSVTAPDFGSVHGTGLPVFSSTAGSTVRSAARKAAGMTAVITPANRTAQDAALQAYVPGSPPRGGPV